MCLLKENKELLLFQGSEYSFVASYDRPLCLCMMQLLEFCLFVCCVSHYSSNTPGVAMFIRMSNECDELSQGSFSTHIGLVSFLWDIGKTRRPIWGNFVCSLEFHRKMKQK